MPPSKPAVSWSATSSRSSSIFRSSRPPTRARQRKGLILEPETPAQDRLDQQVVRGPRHPDPDSEIELPVLTEVDIHGRQELLLLLAQGVESRDRPHRAVILQPDRYPLQQVVGDLHVGREFVSQAPARPVERLL